MILKINYYLMIILCLELIEMTKRCIRDGLEAWRTSEGAQVKEEAQRVDFEPLSESRTTEE
jgi:hypothetical protein